MIRIHNLCVIPARRGSKGVPYKNVKEYCGKPLVSWSIEAARKSKYLNKVVVSTDDIGGQIEVISNKYGADVHHRSVKNSNDNVHAVFAILECLEYLERQYEVDNIIMLLPTSPLRTTDDIDKAIELFEKEQCDSVVSVCCLDKPFSCFRKYVNNYLVPLIPVQTFEKQRQESDKIYEVNGSIFISSSTNLKQNQSFHIGNVMGYEMPKSRSLDINNQDDFLLTRG